MNSTIAKAPVYISVIVPIFNSEKFLERCLKSLSEQSLEASEFILIDDGSSDSSRDICNLFCKSDKRFKLIHQCNSGALVARNRGILEAQGDWIVFVDPDDFLTDKKCLEELLSLAKKNNVDILRFCTKIESSDRRKKENFIKFQGSGEYALKGQKKILNIFFGEERKLGWNLWDKIYRSSVVKKAAKQIENIYLNNGTDIYLLFLIALYSRDFSSIQTSNYYCYCIESGYSVGKMTYNRFVGHCRELKMLGCLKDFLVKESADPVIYKILKDLEDEIISATIHRLTKIPEKDFSLGFDHLRYYLPASSVVSQLKKYYGESLGSLASSLESSNIFSPMCRRVKRIAFFYWRFFYGGVERVISHQLQYFLSKGYEVILITNQIDESKEFFIPRGVRRFIIPTSYQDGRGDALERILKSERVDLLIHHAASSPDLLFDLLIAKCSSVIFAVTRHELTSQPMCSGDLSIVDYPRIYRLCDALVVLNKMELKFYRGFGINVHYIANPLDVKVNRTLEKKKSNEITILWIARLDNLQKNYKEALQILKEVIKVNSNIKAILLGSTDNLNIKKAILNFININSLEGKLIYQGFTLNPEQFYSIADLPINNHHHTSAFL